MTPRAICKEFCRRVRDVRCPELDDVFLEECGYLFNIDNNKVFIGDLLNIDNNKVRYLLCIIKNFLHKKEIKTISKFRLNCLAEFHRDFES